MLPKEEFLLWLAQMKETGEIDDYISTDLTTSFDKQKFYQNDEIHDRVLNFIVHVSLGIYPRDIKELCQKYIDAVHEEMSGKMNRINNFTIWNKK